MNRWKATIDATATIVSHGHGEVLTLTGLRAIAAGQHLEGSFGAADFVAWYDGNPDYPREWALDQESVAVIGNGNVALDVARILVTDPDDLATTDIADHAEPGSATVAALRNCPAHASAAL